jgi:hypothetical protein
MDCPKVKEHLSAYLDGELDLETTNRVRRHLGTCQACRQLLSDLEDTWTSLDALEEMPSPENIVEELRARIRWTVAAAGSRSRYKVWAVGASAAVVLCAFALFAGLSRHAGEEPGTPVPSRVPGSLGDLEAELIRDVEGDPALLEILGELELMQKSGVDPALLENFELLDDLEKASARSSQDEIGLAEAAILLDIEGEPLHD